MRIPYRKWNPGLLLAAVMLFMFVLTMHAFAAEEKIWTDADTGAQLTYQMKGEGICITGIKAVPQDGCLRLPAAIDGTAVTEISAAVYNSESVKPDLVELYIPDSVTEIDYIAFNDYSSLEAFRVDPANPFFQAEDGVLLDVKRHKVVRYPEAKAGTHYEVPAGYQLESCAFFGARNLTSVTLPEGVFRIPNFCFARAMNLERIVIPEGVVSIEGNAFSSFCGEQNKLREVILPSTVREIGSNAFENCSITSIRLPESLESIGERAFSGCSELRTIAIPAKVSRIGAYAFDGCGLLELIRVDPENRVFTEENGALVDNLHHVLLRYPPARRGTFYAVTEGLTPGEGAFSQARYLESIVLPPGTREVPDYFCYEALRLSKIMIPDEVTRIGMCAFTRAGVNAAEEFTVDLPNRLQTVCSHAFADSGVCMIRFPEGLFEIQNEAFFRLKNLRHVYVTAGPVTIMYGNFTENDDLTIYSLADSSIETYAAENGIRFVASTREEYEAEYPTVEQELVLPALEYNVTTNDGTFDLGVRAKTLCSYQNSNPDAVTVSADGTVTPVAPGSAEILIVAVGTCKYQPASAVITVNVTFPRQTLTLKRKGRAVKVTWGKIACADGYQLYVKGPGEKTFRCRVTKPANVKAVTHRGLVRGKTYRYKVRPYKKVGKNIIYGPFSKVRKVRIK